MKICELKIKGSGNLTAIVNALLANGYEVQTAVRWKEFPETGVDYFCVAVFDTTEKGGADNDR